MPADSKSPAGKQAKAKAPRADRKTEDKCDLVPEMMDAGVGGFTFPAFAAFDMQEEGEDAEGGGEIEEVEAAMRMKVAYSHRCSVVSVRDQKGDTIILLRIMQIDETAGTYIVKRPEDFQRLIAKLRAESEESWGGDTVQISYLPPGLFDSKVFQYQDLDKKGKPVPTKLSSNKSDKLTEDVQQALDILMCQVMDLEKSPTLAKFFKGALPAEELDKAVTEWLWNERAKVTMARIVGYWRLKGSRRLWTLYADGRTHLDGTHRGADFDMQEDVREDGGRRIVRGDGWCLDMDATLRDKIVWAMPGKANLVWFRVPEAEAVPQLKKIQNTKK